MESDTPCEFEKCLPIQHPLPRFSLAWQRLLWGITHAFEKPRIIQKKRILRSVEIIVAQIPPCYLPQFVPVPLSFRVMPQKGLQISLLITTVIGEFPSSIMFAPESLYALKLISC